MFVDLCDTYVHLVRCFGLIIIVYTVTCKLHVPATKINILLTQYGSVYWDDDNDNHDSYNYNF